MPGATPFYGWPYPIGTDPLDDAVSVIPQSLATAIENTLRSWGGIATPGTWAAPTGFVGGTVAGFKAVGFRKVGDIVKMRGAASYAGGIGAAGTTMATFAVGFRPAASTERIYAVNMTTGANVPFDITTAGLLVIQTSLAAGTNVAYNMEWSIV